MIFLLPLLSILACGSNGTPAISMVPGVAESGQNDYDYSDFDIINIGFIPCENLDKLENFLSLCDYKNSIEQINEEKDVFCKPNLKEKLVLLLQDCRDLHDFDHEAIPNPARQTRRLPSALTLPDEIDDSDECDHDCDLDKHKPNRRKCCPGYRCVRKHKQERYEGECVRSTSGGGKQPKPKPNPPKPIQPACAETVCDGTIPCCSGNCLPSVDGTRACTNIIDYFPSTLLPGGISGGEPSESTTISTTTSTRIPKPAKPHRPKPTLPTTTGPSEAGDTQVPIILGSTTTKPVGAGEENGFGSQDGKEN